VTYDQQKREAIANAKHLVELLEEISDENPLTTKHDRDQLDAISEATRLASLGAFLLLDQQRGRH